MTRQASDNDRTTGLLLAAALLAALPAIALAQSDDAPPVPAYTDTLLYWPTEVAVEAEVIADTTQVTQHRLTLEEIIARCLQGERTRLAGHEDMSYTSTLRAAMYWEDKKKIEDSVYRSYADADAFSRAILLQKRLTNYKLEDGAWAIDEDAGEDDSGVVEVETGGYSDFADLPVFLEALNDYRFELLERVLEGDHVIFKISFEPKSEFQPLPSGVVYVDTNAYRIVYEEYEFGQNPFPLFLKDIKRIARHWDELPGGEWVFTRIMMEVDLRSDPFGWIPDRVAVVMERDDFEFDTGYDERLFGRR